MPVASDSCVYGESVQPRCATGPERRAASRYRREWLPVCVDELGQPVATAAVLATFDASERERGRLNIMVAYTIRATKDPRSLVYPFYLIERE